MPNKILFKLFIVFLCLPVSANSHDTNSIKNIFSSKQNELFVTFTGAEGLDIPRNKCSVLIGKTADFKCLYVTPGDYHRDEGTGPIKGDSIKVTDFYQTGSNYIFKLQGANSQIECVGPDGLGDESLSLLRGIFLQSGVKIDLKKIEVLLKRNTPPSPKSAK